MDDIVDLLSEIRDAINTMNSNIEMLKNSIDELKGTGFNGNVSDIYDKVDSVESTVEEIKEALPAASMYNMDDIYNVLTNIDTNTM